MSENLEKSALDDYIIVAKNGTIEKIKAPDYGSITIKYTGGSSFKDLNPTDTKDFVKKTYKTAVELFAYLCKKYNLNPEKDGVIISHSEGHKRGIASNHGDVEHIWNKYGFTMAQFRKDVRKAMNGSTAGTAAQEAENRILSTNC